MRIERAPDAASGRDYDLIVVGGGVYGVMLALEATLRDCSVLLLEKEDFGGATSYNSLRIIHGGLRDLQTFGLQRYWTFGRERRWFLEHFPGLVQRLPVLVPLYQRGLMRTSVFRLAFLVDRLLLPRRDRRVNGTWTIPYGQVISSAKVERLFPGVETQHLAGGALWYDACVPDSQRLIVEVLRAACQMGATALNYMPAVELLNKQGQVAGVRARDAQDGETYEFHSGRVVNAAGPWSREVARHFDREPSALNPCLSAWNVLFDRKAPSECAVGAASPGDGKHYFLHPWKGRLLVGTGHAPRNDKNQSPRPSPKEMDDFLQKVNDAFPNLGLGREEVVSVYAGYLPAKRRGSPHLAKEEAWVDHSNHGGPEGLFSVQGTKFTAARSTAERGLARIFPDRTVSEEKRDGFRQARSKRREKRGVVGYDWEPAQADSDWREALAQIAEEESVLHLDDLVLRRTSLGDNPRRALRMAPDLCDLFDWDAERCRKEVKRVEEQYPEAIQREAADEKHV